MQISRYYSCKFEIFKNNSFMPQKRVRLQYKITIWSVHEEPLQSGGCIAARLEKSVDQINKWKPLLVPWSPNQPRRVERNWSEIGVERFWKALERYWNWMKRNWASDFFDTNIPYHATFCFSRPALQSITIGTLLAITVTIHRIKGL